MNRNIEIKERLELALRPAEPPTLEEVLEQVSRRGVLRGPVDWVFPAWMLYVEYATQKIAETFPLSEEERNQLFHFRDAMKRLLREAWMQAKEKLVVLYKAVAENVYRVEGKRLYAPDGTWMYLNKTVFGITIRAVSVETYFPDVLKLPHEKLKLFQLGWRASDEGNNGNRPFIGTTQPWQVFAWSAVRYGRLHLHIAKINITREGVSVTINVRSKSWKQEWDKERATELVVEHLKSDTWEPLLAMWLGDGESRRGEVLKGSYKIVVAHKNPEKLGPRFGVRKALVASGRKTFEKLKSAAGTYGLLLDLLQSHKWINLKLTDTDFKTNYLRRQRRLNKLKMLDKSTLPSSEHLYEKITSFADSTDTQNNSNQINNGNVIIAGVKMSLNLIYSRFGTLLAKRLFKDVGQALLVVEMFEGMGLRPNIHRAGSFYAVYVSTTDLVRLAEKDESVRRSIVSYLINKMRNGTPKQRETAKKILERYPVFSNLLN
jgi:hypothetical protein